MRCRYRLRPSGLRGSDGPTGGVNIRKHKNGETTYSVVDVRADDEALAAPVRTVRDSDDVTGLVGVRKHRLK